MKLFPVIALLLVGFLSSGCSMKHAMNADEFRKMLPESMFGETEKVNVKQPIGKIAKTFKKKAKECLNISLKRTSCVSSGYGGQSCSTSIMHYHPTVLASKKKVELHIQMEIEGAMVLGTPPKGGMYTLVADVFPTGRNKSRLELYYGSMGYDTLVKAIKGWASGRSKGCPDLTSG